MLWTLLFAIAPGMRHGNCYTDNLCRDSVPQQMSLKDCCCSIGQGWSVGHICQQCPLGDSGECCFGLRWLSSNNVARLEHDSLISNNFCLISLFCSNVASSNSKKWATFCYDSCLCLISTLHFFFIYIHFSWNCFFIVIMCTLLHAVSMAVLWPLLELFYWCQCDMLVTSL